MKLLYSTLLLFVVTTTTVSATTIRAVTNNGKWNQAATWNLNRKPQNGDTVVIPNNIQVVLDNNESLNNLVVRVTGALRLNGGKLNLNAGSRVDIMTGGTLTGSGNNDQVRIGGAFKFRGGFDLPILGPAFADTSTGTSPNGFLAGLSLLSELTTDFVVNRTNGDAHISWTSVPGNTIQFDVEKSVNGISWSVIKTITVTGDRNSRQRYSYIDKNITTAYYRVKQVLPASVAYTAVKAITENENAGIDVYAGPRGSINIRLNETASFPVKIVVTDMAGRVVQQESFERAASMLNVQLRSAAKGVVVVNVADAAGKARSRMIAL